MIVEKDYASILTRNIPKHWEIYRVGNIFRERTEKVSDKDFDPLSVTMKGIVPQLENVAKTNHGDNRKKVCTNDFVINSRSDRKGSGGMSRYDGSVSLINTVLKPNSKYENRYTNYLFTNVLFQEEFYKFGKGIVDDMWSTKYFDMKYIKVPCPPISEQVKIADYLDSQQKKIKHFIKKKQTFIELLKEQRQAVIENAVTKGKRFRVKNLVTINDEALSEKTDNNYQLKYIDIGNVKSDGSITEIQTLSFKDAPSRARRIVRKGDVIISTVRTYLQAITLIDFDEEDIVVSTGFAVLRPKKGINSEYLNYVLRDNKFIGDVITNSFGVSYPAINSTTLSALSVNVVLDEKEQTQIVSHIKTETAKIDETIAKAQKEIELIKEYKEAMIAEAVLGKYKMSEL